MCPAKSLISFLLVLACSVFAQDSRPAETQDGISALIHDLGSEKFKVREEAFEKLRSLGAEALPHLRKNSTNADPEIRSRVETLIDLIENPDRPAPGAVEEEDRDKGRKKVTRDRSRTWRRGKIQEDEEDEPLADRQWRWMPKIEDYDDLFEFNRALNEWMREQTRSLLPRDRGGLGWPFDDPAFKFEFRFPGDGKSKVEGRISKDGESLAFTREEDGRIRLEVTTVKDGATDRKVYEAASLEQFKEEYPDVYAKYEETGIFNTGQGFHGFRLTPPGLEPGPWSRFFDELDEREGKEQEPGRRRPSVESRPESDRAKVAKRQRLGVEVGTVTAPMRTQLGIDEGCGLLVMSVEPRSLAEAIGLKEHDVLVKYDGRELESTLDLKRAFEATEPGKEFRIEIVRQAKRLVLEGTR